MRTWLFAALALAAMPAAAAARPRDPAMDAAVRDLCPRQVAMLGEGSHGDGATFAFKAALIRRLVSECGYNAVLFEASHYDFVELMRRLRAREEATPAMFASAIGGVWSHYAELSPLIAFLFERARAGRLTLGGLDDQLGSADAFYSNDEMLIQLTAQLPPETRTMCRAALHRRIYSGTPQTSPDRENTHADLARCATEMRAAAHGDAAELALNIDRLFERDFSDEATMMRRRDASMFENLRWYAGRLGRRAKIIIWAHNAHIARDATAYPGFAGGGNLGAWVDRTWGRRAFALGFSAYGGGWQRPPFMAEPRPIVPAPAGSLEASAMAGSDAYAVYRNAGWLARLGRVPGRPYHYQFAPFDWSRAFDGLVVFRAERGPRLAR